jgi:hypothetical protein
LRDGLVHRRHCQGERSEECEGFEKIAVGAIRARSLFIERLRLAVAVARISPQTKLSSNESRSDQHVGNSGAAEFRHCKDSMHGRGRKPSPVHVGETALFFAEATASCFEWTD